MAGTGQQLPESAGDDGSHIAVGRILGAHGVFGEIRARSLTDVPHRFDPGQELFIRNQPYCIASVAQRPPDQVFLKLDGLDTPEVARALAGELLTIPSNAVPPLPEGEYFHFQLMGLEVFTEEGEDLGRISDILVTGSNDVYVVSGQSGDLLLPAVAQVVRVVDLERGTMTVRLMDGLR